jgi:hypothetical protein
MLSKIISPDICTASNNHGASGDQAFVQVAITSRLKGPTAWLQTVSDEECQAGE